jgi:hypothetical protein
MNPKTKYFAQHTRAFKEKAHARKPRETLVLRPVYFFLWGE